MAQLIWPAEGCALFRGSFTVRCQVLESGFEQQFPRGNTLTVGQDLIPHASWLLTPLTMSSVLGEETQEAEEPQTHNDYN